MSETNDKKQDKHIRPPVVVILGHVDHGKTSILDKIRQTKIAEREAGGITQHIGAYKAVHNGKQLTFLDTPGHEAFSAIRSRGAKVADIAVLVIAADEGLKPQTKEAINIIKETKTTFVVAINKIDKDGANPQRIRQELAEQEILVEDYGGQVPVVELSAKTGQGIDDLLEIILLAAELEELSYDPQAPASGVVIESHLDHRRGYVATLLVLDGRLAVGDWLSAGRTFAKLKSLSDFASKPIDSASASDPVVALGWSDAPELGAEFHVYDSADKAEVAAREAALSQPSELFVRETGPEKTTAKTFNLIVKADVLSSLEAIDQVLRTIPAEEVSYQVVDYGVGDIGDGDIKKAVATGAAVIGFHVSMGASIKQLAEREHIRVEVFDIIYKLVESVREQMSDLLDPEVNKNTLGRLKVLAIFKKEARSQIIGGKVMSGQIVRGVQADVMRGEKLLGSGKIGQLQTAKQDVSEVAEGHEAGIRLDLPPTKGSEIPVIIKEGDTLEVYQVENIKRSI